MVDSTPGTFHPEPGRGTGRPGRRLVVVSPGDPFSYRTQSGVARNVADELSTRFDVIGRIDASMTGRQTLAAASLAFRPFREASALRGEWRPRRDQLRRAMTHDPRAFQARSGNLVSGLRDSPEFDLLFQVRQVYEPTEVPFVTYIDSTLDTMRSVWPESIRWPARHTRIFEERERRMLLAAKHVFTVSARVADSVTTHYGVDSSRVTVVGGGLNRQAMPAQVHPPRRERIAFFAGLEFTRKGGRELLRAFAQVRDAIPDARLILAGTSHRIDEPGVENLGRVQDASYMDQLYRDARVFCLPARYEPYGLVYLEAMAHGTPCIASRTNAGPEIITDGVDGRLVHPGSEADIVEALRFFLEDDGERSHAFGIRARQKVLDEMRWSNVVERMVPDLEAVLGDIRISAAGKQEHRPDRTDAQ